MATHSEIIVNIGKSVVIKGELNVVEDLMIDGLVEGVIELRNHVLTVGPHGRVNAKVFAKSVIVLGEVTGTITATDKIDIRDNGSVDGDVISPRVRIAEGAHFHGFVEMPNGRRLPSTDGSNPSVWLPPAAPGVDVDRSAADPIRKANGSRTGAEARAS